MRLIKQVQIHYPQHGGKDLTTVDTLSHASVTSFTPDGIKFKQAESRCICYPFTSETADDVETSVRNQENPVGRID